MRVALQATGSESIRPTIAEWFFQVLCAPMSGIAADMSMA